MSPMSQLTEDKYPSGDVYKGVGPNNHDTIGKITIGDMSVYPPSVYLTVCECVRYRIWILQELKKLTVHC